MINLYYLTLILLKGMMISIKALKTIINLWIKKAVNYL